MLNSTKGREFAEHSQSLFSASWVPQGPITKTPLDAGLYTWTAMNQAKRFLPRVAFLRVIGKETTIPSISERKQQRRDIFPCQLHRIPNSGQSLLPHKGSKVSAHPHCSCWTAQHSSCHPKTAAGAVALHLQKDAESITTCTFHSCTQACAYVLTHLICTPNLSHNLTACLYMQSQEPFLQQDARFPVHRLL